MMVRKHLSGQGLFDTVYRCFQKVKDPLRKGRKNMTIIDYMMSALAIFSLKFPSLLQYDEQRHNPNVSENFKNLFHVQTPPSDTAVREVLDHVDPASIRPAFKKLFALLQRGKALEPYQILNGHYLISVDGTGFFSSSKVKCENCCVKTDRQGKTTYYHQLLGAAVVHPDHKVVVPLCPEMIQKQDGSKKNDCERNAAKRFLENLRREHPHLKAIIVEDALAANAPHINHLETFDFKYIIGVKPGDHEYLFDWFNNGNYQTFEYTTTEGVEHRFHYLNDLPLNEANKDKKVNFIEYWEKPPKGKAKHFSWITNIEVTQSNITEIMKGARARWRIDNETFNTLKNQGYNFEHNYGHGYKHLSHNFSQLMMLAFLIDQSQLLCCRAYQAARSQASTFRALWESMRVFFLHIPIASWTELFQIISLRSIPPPKT